MKSGRSLCLEASADTERSVVEAEVAEVITRLIALIKETGAFPGHLILPLPPSPPRLMVFVVF